MQFSAVLVRFARLEFFGVQRRKELAPGVYGLLSSKPPADNSGFVVGERGVLVIDAHINGDMARQIQEAETPSWAENTQAHFFQGKN